MQRTGFFVGGFACALALVGLPLRASQDLARRVSYALNPCAITLHDVSGGTVSGFSGVLDSRSNGMCANNATNVTFAYNHFTTRE